MEFEWDEAKSAGNKLKQGISFEEVALRMGGEGFIDSFPNPSQNPKHIGQMLVRFSTEDGREWTAVVEPRNDRIRIITVQQRRKYRSKK